LQSVNSMDFMVRALRGWSVPMVLPVAKSWQTFDPDGRLVDEMVAVQLRELGGEVVRAARQFQAEGTCDYADSAQFSPDGREQRASAGAEV
jgi:FMN reductase